MRATPVPSARRALATILPLTLVALALTALVPSAALAHATRSATVLIHEAAPGRAVVRVRTAEAEDAVTVAFDPPCREDAALVPDTSDVGTVPAISRAQGFTCDGPLAGRSVVISGFSPILSEAIVSTTFADGRTAAAIVREDEPRAELPAAATFLGTARQYVRLGVLHIFAGVDHLMFLALLVLALRQPRKVILAETAFTLSHCLSFSATALGIVRVSSAAAEACIAASLLLLALDIGRRKQPPSAREGAFTALLFGVFHGLGFAGGLREIGVPDANVGAALAGFAAGVEMGQLAFLLVALALVAWVEKRRSFTDWQARAAVLAGGVSLYWFVDRALSCVWPRGWS